jgi:hypothetical protein
VAPNAKITLTNDAQGAASAREVVEPLLYQPLGTGAARRAQNPVTGEILPAVFIGAMVPGVGDINDGLVRANSGGPRGLIKSRGAQWVHGSGSRIRLTTGPYSGWAAAYSTSAWSPAPPPPPRVL